MAFELLIGGIIGFICTVVIGYSILWYKYDRRKLGFLINIDDDELYG
jgi:hypothetical protein